MNYNKLTPEKFPKSDLLLCDVKHATLKDIIQELEHPFYSLSKKPELSIREYKHNGNHLKITPSVKGLPTIYDKDILVYCISHIMKNKKEGQPISRTVRFSGYDYLTFTNRGTSSKDYKALNDSIIRLKGLVIDTNIKTGNTIENRVFGLIEDGGFVTTNDSKRRLKHIEITLSKWVYNAIEADEVLTLHKDYFRLRKPIEKRLYELFRKHCGNQEFWNVSIKKLHLKSGTKMSIAKFKWNLKEIIRNNHLPDYNITLNDEDNVITVINTKNDILESEFNISSDTYNLARKILPRTDIYSVYEDWKKWQNTKEESVFDCDNAFIGFCKIQSAKTLLKNTK